MGGGVELRASAFGRSAYLPQRPTVLGFLTKVSTYNSPKPSVLVSANGEKNQKVSSQQHNKNARPAWLHNVKHGPRDKTRTREYWTLSTL